MLNWVSAMSRALSTTHSFCSGDREHVEYTTSPPGLVARIPALQARGTHTWSGEDTEGGTQPFPPTETGKPTGTHRSDRQTPLNATGSAVTAI